MVVVLLPPLHPAMTTLTIALTRQGGCQKKKEEEGNSRRNDGDDDDNDGDKDMDGRGREGEGGGGRRMMEQPPLYMTWATSTPTSRQ